MNYKKLFLFGFLMVSLLVLSGCGVKNNNGSVAPAEDDSEIILFYGTECPHCHEVDKYISENKVSEKVQFSRREVFHNDANSALMTEKAKECGIKNLESLGVPFLWAEGQCIIGQGEVIQFFQEKNK